MCLDAKISSWQKLYFYFLYSLSTLKSDPETKYIMYDMLFAACQKQCQDLQARLASREATIEVLEGRLAAQQKQCERRIEEIEVERQQDQYVARMLEQQKNGRSRKPVTKTNNAYKVKR